MAKKVYIDVDINTKAAENSIKSLDKVSEDLLTTVKEIKNTTVNLDTSKATKNIEESDKAAEDFLKTINTLLRQSKIDVDINTRKVEAARKEVQRLEKMLDELDATVTIDIKVKEDAKSKIKKEIAEIKNSVKSSASGFDINTDKSVTNLGKLKKGTEGASSGIEKLSGAAGTMTDVFQSTGQGVSGLAGRLGGLISRIHPAVAAAVAVVGALTAAVMSIKNLADSVAEENHRIEEAFGKSFKTSMGSDRFAKFSAEMQVYSKALEVDLERMQQATRKTAELWDISFEAAGTKVYQGLRGLAKEQKEEFIDQLNEYGTQFRKLNMGLDDSLNVLRSSVQLGTTDKLADMIKEFSLKRSAPLNPEDTAALQNAGLADLWQKNLDGAISYVDFQDQVMNKLRELKAAGQDITPVLKAIWGTPGEDIGEMILKLDVFKNQLDGLEWVGSEDFKNNSKEIDDSLVKIIDNIETLSNLFGMSNKQELEGIQAAVKAYKEGKLDRDSLDKILIANAEKINDAELKQAVLAKFFTKEQIEQIQKQKEIQTLKEAALQQEIQNQAAVNKAASDLGKAYEEAANKFQLAFGDSFTKIKIWVYEAATSIINFVTKVIEYFGDLNTKLRETESFASSIGDALRVVGSILSVIGSPISLIVSGFSTIYTLITSISNGTSVWHAVLNAMFPTINALGNMLSWIGQKLGILEGVRASQGISAAELSKQNLEQKGDRLFYKGKTTIELDANKKTTAAGGGFMPKAPLGGLAAPKGGGGAAKEAENAMDEAKRRLAAQFEAENAMIERDKVEKKISETDYLNSKIKLNEKHRAELFSLYQSIATKEAGYRKMKHKEEQDYNNEVAKEKQENLMKLSQIDQIADEEELKRIQKKTEAKLWALKNYHKREEELLKFSLEGDAILESEKQEQMLKQQLEFNEEEKAIIESQMKQIKESTTLDAEDKKEALKGLEESLLSIQKSSSEKRQALEINDIKKNREARNKVFKDIEKQTVEAFRKIDNLVTSGAINSSTASLQKDQVVYEEYIKRISTLEFYYQRDMESKKLTEEQKTNITRQYTKEREELMRGEQERSEEAAARIEDEIKHRKEDSAKKSIEASKNISPLAGAFTESMFDISDTINKTKQLEDQIKAVQSRLNTATGEEKEALEKFRKSLKLELAFEPFLKSLKIAGQMVEGMKSLFTELYGLQINLIDAGIKKRNEEIEQLEKLDEKNKELMEQEEERFKLRQEMQNALSEQRIKELEDIKENVPEAEKEAVQASIDREKAKIRQIDESKDSSMTKEKMRIEELQRANEQAEREKAALQRKQFEIERIASIAQIFINTGIAIMNGYAQMGPIGGSIAGAIISTLATAQVALVASQPNPYNKGTLRVAGNDETKDSVYAYLTPGEAVIPVKQNKEYAPTIKAIYNNEIPNHVLNSFVKDYKNPVTYVYKNTSANNSNTEDTDKIVAAIKSQSKVNINLTEEGLRALIQRENTSTTYMNKKLNGFV